MSELGGYIFPERCVAGREELVPLRSVDGGDKVPCGVTERVELWEEIGVFTREVSLSYICSCPVQGLNDVGNILGEELFGPKNRDGFKVAIPQRGVGGLVGIVRDDGGCRVRWKGRGSLVDRLGAYGGLGGSFGSVNLVSLGFVGVKLEVNIHFSLSGNLVGVFFNQGKG